LAIWADGWLTYLLAALVLLLLLGKPFIFRYPSGMAEAEFVLMLCHPAVQGVRNWLGSVGNKQERSVFVAGFLATSAWSMVVAGYFWRLQANGLWLECFLAAVALGLAVLEVLGAALAGVFFCESFSELLLVFLGFCTALAGMALVYFLDTGWL
ncbi:unnamed protein product, partial [Polarella glacialis]